MPKRTLVKVSQYLDDTNYETFPTDVVNDPLSGAALKTFEKQVATLIAPYVTELKKRNNRPQCITLTIELET